MVRWKARVLKGCFMEGLPMYEVKLTTDAFDNEAMLTTEEMEMLSDIQLAKEHTVLDWVYEYLTGAWDDQVADTTKMVGSMDSMGCNGSTS